MSKRKRVWISWWNLALAAATLGGGVVTAVAGNWVAAAIFAIASLAIVAGAVYARSGRASDLARLSAAEYVDERDRAVGIQALAIVGVAGLLLSVLVFLLGMLLLEPGSPMFVVLWAQLILLTIAWAVANWVALRRS